MIIKIAVIGCGNMSWPIIKRIHHSYPDIEFHTYTPSKTKSKLLSIEVNGVHHDELNSIGKMDYWFIAFKPQQLEQFAVNIGSQIYGEKIISILLAIVYQI